MHLSRLLYTSRACPSPSIADPADQPHVIASQARERNAQSGVTGCLVLVDGNYLQILEGAPDRVEETFERICKDMRHTEVRLIDLVRTTDRAFEGWNMACLDAGAENGEDAVADDLRYIKNLAGLNATQAVACMRELVMRR